MATRTVKVGARVGLHARPATILAEVAEKYGFEILIALAGDDDPVDADSALAIMSLGAVNGDEVTLSSGHPEAEAALEELATLIASDLDAE